MVRWSSLPFAPGARLAQRLGRGIGDPNRGRLQRFHGYAQLFLELAALVQLRHNVAAPDKLSRDVELRNGRPRRIGLDAVANFGIGEHVEGFVLGKHAVEDADDAGGEAALGRAAVTLHEQHDAVLLDQGCDALSGMLGLAHTDSFGAAARAWGRRITESA